MLLEDGDALPYDTLVLATGARHAYFGHDEWEPFAPGLKTLEDATTLRRRILVAFERAERETDPERRAALLTFVIIGAGPTGVELAGTIADLAQDTLPPDFRNIDTSKARVVLIEAGPRVLAGFPDDLSAYAQRSLEEHRRRSDAGTSPSPNAPPTAWSMAARSLEARTHHLGRRRARLTAPPNGWARRPTAPAACRSSLISPFPAIPISLRSAIPSTIAGPGRKAGARHRAGGQAAGPLCRRHSSRRGLSGDAARPRSVTSMPAAWRRSASG